MPATIRLVPMPEETSFTPLGVLGYCLSRSDFLAPVWSELTLPVKQVEYPVKAKLLDIIVSILAGCRAISQVNSRLRPDLALAQAWGRESFAEQSTLSRTLDAFGEVHLAQLRQGNEALFRRESGVFGHDFGQEWLWLDIDLTPLPISKHAEASTKGKFAKKTATVDNWLACRPPSTMRPCSLKSIQANKTAVPPIFRCSRRWKTF
jgi:hypothetical protein